MGLWECGQSRPKARNPKTAQIRIVHRFPCSPRRAEPKAPVHKNNADKRKGGKNGGNPCPKPETRKQRKTRIVHMLSTLSAPPRTKNSRTTRKDKNPERRPSPSLEADESDPAQPRRGKTRTNPQRPAPAAIPPESRRPRDTMDGESYFGIDTRPNECANHAALRKNEGATRRRPEPTTEPARRQNTENWGILLRRFWGILLRH